ncbi:c-type cytochrome [Massilia niastensis]|uniref:c-type cytochrome n=1 Tax=Massilia niastensis TaxID=544911 RepID=UPI000370C35E|nr:cytochrome c family protein [Massilia niastensis]
MRRLAMLPLLLAAAGAAHGADPLEAGRRVFNRCANCHQVGPNAHSAFGPQLNGIIGRRAGAAGDYAYSPAMKNSRIVWDEKSLAAFLRDPDRVVPGNKMRFWGLNNERQIADLLAYLRSHAAPATAPRAAR